MFQKRAAGAEQPAWYTHFRLDSSPQFARNYLVGELDFVRLDHVSAATDDDIDSLYPGAVHSGLVFCCRSSEAGVTWVTRVCRYGLAR